MHRYEMCQGKSMFSPVLNLQFIYEVAVLLLFDFRCLPFLLRTRCSIICISCIMYNYWAYLKVSQYAEEILRLAKVSLLCQGCGRRAGHPRHGRPSGQRFGAEALERCKT